MLNGAGLACDESVRRELLGSDKGQHGHILSEFEDSLNGCCSKFKSAWQGQSFEAMKAAAHKLKSSVLTVGAGELAECAIN